MSSSNSNNNELSKKSNLFELKHSSSNSSKQNKYAQLVEVQTPEPHDDDNHVDLLGQGAGLKEVAEGARNHLNDATQPIANLQDLQLQGSKGEEAGTSSGCSRLRAAVKASSSSSGRVRPRRAGAQMEGSECADDGSLSYSILNRIAAKRRKSAASAKAFDSNSEGGARPLNASQMSTSFVSTLSMSQWISGSSSAVDFGAHLVGGGHMKRTISQSMLELESEPSRLSNFEVSWSELSFSYKPSLLARLRPGAAKAAGRHTRVLQNLTGSFKSNQLVAVIGPSGCGKTTLLHFLAGNNGAQRDKLRIVGMDEPKVALIGQGDCLLPGLTARETLIYASRLQNSNPLFDHHRHVQPILEALGLADCSDRNVTKLSGGQLKRVSIAQELLYPTNLLILDEVTSGLDASTSYSIVRLLKQLVADRTYPMSIVMSIHQPSARLFSVFDRVYVMSEGSCLYEGSCQVDQVNDYLALFGLECPKFHNIADYLIEIASDDLSSCGANEVIKQQMIKHQCDAKTDTKRSSFSSTEQEEEKSFRANGQEPAGLLASDDTANGFYTNELSKESDKDQNSALLDLKQPGHSLHEAIERARSRRERPISSHFMVHFNRSLVRIKRSSILTYLQLVTYILLGLQLATFYGADIGSLNGCPHLPISFMAFVFSDDSVAESLTLEMRRIQENMNFLLVAIMTATFAALEITVITFPLEAKTVKREWRNGWYRVSSYFMGRTLADLPFQMAFVVAFCVVIYTLTGQIGFASWRFVSFVTIMIMTALIAQAVGFIFGALFMDNLPAAVFTAPLCIFPALLFSGFFSRVSQIPTFYKPMTYLSHFRYAFDALLVTLYGFQRCQCDQSSLNEYHESLQNQSSAIKGIFNSLFGSVDCVSSTTSAPLGVAAENSIEDTSPSLEMLLAGSTTNGSSPRPPFAGASMQPLEDALVDSVFEHMVKNTTDAGEHEQGGAMDHLVRKFSSRVTKMLNSQSNFGHQVPERCEQFNSYLMTEFDLRDDDLIFGLAMLLVGVLITRLLCHGILTFTIATRAT